MFYYKIYNIVILCYYIWHYYLNCLINTNTDACLLLFLPTLKHNMCIYKRCPY